jgi:hypothetical protein
MKLERINSTFMCIDALYFKLSNKYAEPNYLCNRLFIVLEEFICL